VRFQLLVERNQSGPYRAELSTLDGETVYSVDSLEAVDSSTINLDIYAAVLKVGDYQIKLRRLANGSLEDVATYYFQVR
jgi:hypothetical protein